MNEILYLPEEIDKAIKDVSTQLTNKFPKGFHAMAILNGAFIFAADLVRHCNVNMTIGFIKATSYKDNKSTGEVAIDLVDPLDISGKDVVIIEDIIDTGLTIEKIREFLLIKQRVKSVTTVCLFDKQGKSDFTVFGAPDCYIGGYGLDDNHFHRNKPFIYKV